MERPGADQEENDVTDPPVFGTVGHNKIQTATPQSPRRLLRTHNFFAFLSFLA